MPKQADIIAAQLTQRRLNSRDKGLQRQLQGAPDDLPMDELSPANIAQLMSAIQQAPSAQQRAVLQAELDRLRSLAENLGKYQPRPSNESGVVTAPYNPGDPSQRPQFQQRPFVPESQPWKPPVSM